MAKVKCSRCEGKGYRMLIAGPMLVGGQGSPGGKVRYDCRACGGSGKVTKTQESDRRLKLSYGLQIHERFEGDYVPRWGTGKSAFLEDARDYLKALMKHLGWAKGLLRGAVQINPGGIEAGGDVFAIMFPTETAEAGVYVSIQPYTVPGEPPTRDPNQQVSIMYRGCTRDDIYGTRSHNRWRRGDITVGELATLFQKELPCPKPMTPPTAASAKSKKLTLRRAKT